MGVGPAAELGGAGHQVGVGCGADAHHEHARAAAHRGDRIKKLLLVADAAVSQEDDLPHAVAVGVVVGQRRAHRRDHLGAARRLQRSDERLGLRQMLAVGRHHVSKQHAHGVIEADHVEPVARLQSREREKEAGLGLGDGGAPHRAGIVDDKNHLAWQRLLLGVVQERRRHKGQQIVTAGDLFVKQPDRRRFLDRRGPRQLEVAVGRSSAVGECDHTGGTIRAVDLDVVEVAFHFAKRKPRLQADADGRRVDWRAVLGVVQGIENRRRNALAVRDRIVGDDAPALSFVRRSTVCSTGAGL